MVFQRHVFGLWDNIWQMDERFLKELCEFRKIGVEDMTDSETGLLRDKWWTWEKEEQSGLYRAMEIMVKPSIIGSLDPLRR